MPGLETQRRQGRGIAADELRRHNLGVLLERLDLEGPLSRSALASSTGLNRSTIADLIGRLGSLGLVVEGPAIATVGPGRPSPLVRVRPEGAVVLAVELAVDSIAVATVGLGGHVYRLTRIARPRERFSPEQTVQDTVRAAEPLLDALPAGHRFAGVGVAVVGITRRSDGFVHLAPNLGWHDVPVGPMLAAALGTAQPVRVANDADLGALAEHRRVHRSVGHLIYVSGEVGIGLGVIADGKPLLGSAGYAGEAGHSLINPQGVICRCGALGCWETEAGEGALLRRAGLGNSDTGLGVVDTVAERARAGHKPTLLAIDEVGHWLGLGIGNLINIFNPELVVLGGLYHGLFGFLQASVTDGVRRRVLDAPGQGVRVVRSGLGSDAAVIGAAELVLTEVIADPARIRT